MKTNLEKLNETEAKLNVAVEYSELRPYIEKVYTEIATNNKFDGFRKGHAPKAVINQRFSKAGITTDAINDAMPEFFRLALDEGKVVPIAEPKVELKKVGKEESESPYLEFTLTMEIRPEIKIPALDSIKVEVDPIKIDKASVDESLENLRASFGTLVEVKRAAKDGDFVLIDMKSYINDEEIDSVVNTSYHIGEKEQLVGLDDALIGLKKGNETTFDTVLAGGEYAGKDSTVKLKVNSVKENELPPLDDEFAKIASAFDTLKELREDLESHYKLEATQNQVSEASRLALKKLLDSTKIPLPSGIVKEKEESVAEYFKQNPEAEKPDDKTIQNDIALSVKQDLLISTLSDELNIEIKDDDFNMYVTQLAYMHGREPGEIFAQIQQQNQINQVIGEITSLKTSALLVRKIQIVDKKGQKIDFSAVKSGFADIDEQTNVVEPKTKKG